ncbi:MAG: YlxR family protein, partial [Actinomycetota bacterium]
MKGSTLATTARSAPVRTCIACRTARHKDELVRIAASPDGVGVDHAGTLPGRGAYVCPDPGCQQQLRRRR